MPEAATLPHSVSALIVEVAFKLERDGLGQYQDAWDEHPDNQMHVVSAEESLVFDIDPRRWPLMSAALGAFENYSGFCHTGEWPDECWDEVRRDRPDIPRDMGNVEAFAEFCVYYTTLSPGEAYRAWYKWNVWHFRMDYSFYPTCTNKISNSYRMAAIQRELAEFRKPAGRIASFWRRHRYRVAIARDGCGGGI